jgi:heptosyltransferase-2
VGGWVGPPLPDEACALARERLSSRLRSRKGCVAFAPGARWKTKRWPADHFAKLISTVSARDYAPVLIGGTEDIADNAAIARAVSPEEPLDLTGSLSIIESAAILRECAALVTNDSAPLHLAEAVGTPVVALFGPTVREFGYYPILRRSMALEVDLPCRPCSRNGARSCPYGTEECLTSIEPEAVLEALLGVLRTAGRS